MKSTTDNASSLTHLEMRLDILRLTYWEHFKFYNDKSMSSHVKLPEVEAEIKIIVDEMDAIKERIEKLKSK